jgi:hypothetical protein
LHNQKVWIINVKLDRLEEVLHRLLLRAVAIDQVLGCAAQYYLPRDTNLRIFFKTYRAVLLVPVVKDDCDASFRDASLSALVYEILRCQL